MKIIKNNIFFITLLKFKFSNNCFLQYLESVKITHKKSAVLSVNSLPKVFGVT